MKIANNSKAILSSNKVTDCSGRFVDTSYLGWMVFLSPILILKLKINTCKRAQNVLPITLNIVKHVSFAVYLASYIVRNIMFLAVVKLMRCAVCWRGRLACGRLGVRITGLGNDLYKHIPRVTVDVARWRSLTAQWQWVPSIGQN